jgi:hypothetical protein
MLASLFLLYEMADIFANLGGGWLATRFGIPRMLATGLVLQIGGLLLLSALDPGWGAALSVAWAVTAQGISGIAKDITKTASKSAIKATSEGGAGQLFRWVAWFTGSKNAMKGFGFFLGGVLLETVGFKSALWGRPKRPNRLASCLRSRAPSIFWPPRASSCSGRGTSGSSSAFPCFSMPMAGNTPK